MSTPRYDWWPYVKGVIRRFPSLKEEYEQGRKIRITAKYDAGPKPPGAARTTENVVVRTMSGVHGREYAAVETAINHTLRKQAGKERMELIRLLYWERSKSLSGAANAINISYRTARRWNSEFIYLVAKNYGLME